MKINSRKFIILISLVMIFCLSVNTYSTGGFNVSPALACENHDKNDETTISDIPLLIDLEDYINSEINQELEDYGIVGVTVSVVQDGEMVFSKGYGYADYYYQTPVLPDETLFRIGSISKTFTAIAAMQLVELGLLDLDTDINTYLTAFKIPETYLEPITIRHLLTHTAGFEVSTSQVIYEALEAMPSLEDDLKNNIPERVRLPGELTGYSNYGNSLVGYIVQEIAGIPFVEYIEEKITLPLGMNSTTCRQQLPAELQDDMSPAYFSTEEPGFYEYFSIYPAGGFTTKATDMATFMMMLLNNGTYNNVTILEESSVQEMFSDQYVVHPDMPGVGLGVYETDYRNAHIIGHGGDTIFFHSNMMLFPEENFGLFISYNSQTGIFGRSRFINGFLNNFYYFSRTVEPIENYKQRARMFTGDYVSTRRYYSTKNGVDALIWSQYYSINITSSRGYLQVTGLEVDFVEVTPNFFVERTGDYDYSIFFGENEEGQITYMNTNWAVSITTMERMHSSYTNIQLQSGLLIFIGTVSLISLSLWGIDAFFRWKKGKERGKTLLTVSKVWHIGFLTSAIVTVILMMKINHETIILSTETSTAFQNVLSLPYISLVFIVGNIVFTFFAWFGFGNIDKKPYWDLLTRIQYTLLTAFSLAYMAFPIYWQLFIF
ncbi:MAG: beta-lactamase family protein [Candidatus Heimdallarchaeota archaeon]|nr:beta-lactamase family protein [Candidatus Heimdallarchaeota archaeon]